MNPPELNLPRFTSVFPKPSFREHQREALESIQDGFEDGSRVVVLEAPTGAGKSPLCVAASNAFGSAYLTTPLISLMGQYEQDDFPEVKYFKGRSRYDCPASIDDSCATGPCRTKTCGNGRVQRDCFKHEPLCGVNGGGECTCDVGLCYDCPCPDCPYTVAYMEFASARTGCTNTTMLMVHPKFSARRLLVVDEAHMLPDFAMSQVEVRMNNFDVGDIPEKMSWQDRVDWLGRAKNTLSRNYDRIYNRLLTEQFHDSKDFRQLDHLERVNRKIEFLLADWAKAKEEWVQEYSTWESGNSTRQKLSLRPVTIGRFLRKLVWDKAEYILLSDATPPVLEDVGLDGVKSTVVSVPSPIPVKNRTWRYEPQGKMTVGCRAATIPKIARKIIEIDSLGIGKMIVHCHSYAIMDSLFEGITEMRGPMPMLQNRMDREGSLRDWCEKDNARIFLSVGMEEGIDLVGDVCRVGVLTKVQFPFWGDPQVRLRCEKEGKDWYYRCAIYKLVQAAGRHVRSPEDWGLYYILDSSFKFLWDRYRKAFPRWFREARVGQV